MQSKTYLLVVMVLLLAIGMGCGGGGSSSGGGSTTDPVVGTWNRVSYSGNGNLLPTQIIFKSDGTGTLVGVSPSAFSWTHQGNTLTVTQQGYAPVTVTFPSDISVGFTLITTTNGTATYLRA